MPKIKRVVKVDDTLPVKSLRLSRLVVTKPYENIRLEFEVDIRDGDDLQEVINSVHYQINMALHRLTKDIAKQEEDYDIDY